MPISVGEVNASIRFAIASAELDAAKSKLKDLAEEFNETGGAATVSGQRILDTMGPLQDRIEAITRDAQQLRIEVAQYETSTGLRALKQQADQASQSFDQMQMLALRMGERMLILYALRETFNFVKGLYDGAEALVQLSDRTQMSITYLQQLQDVGEENSVSAKSLSSAINELDKNLDEMKGGDALKEIGLSFGQIFAMNPDQRFETIATRIAAIPSPTERAKVEIQLFGTDAIDPLIVKMGQLGPAINKMQVALDDTTARTMAATKSAFVEVGEAVGGMAAHMLTFAQNSVSLLASPFFVMAKEGLPGLKDMYNNTAMFALSIVDVNKAAAATPPIPPLMGQAFIDSLKQQVPLTKEQTSALDQLRAMGELTYQTAVKATAQNQITEAQYKAYEKSVRDATKAQTEHEAELRKDEEAYKHFQGVIDEVLTAGTNWKTTVTGMSDVLRDHVKTLLEAGVGEKAIEEWTGATATQVHAVVKELKDEADARALVTRTAADQAKIMAQLQQIRADDEASDLQKHLNANQRKYEDDVATAQKRGIVDAGYYAALEALRNAEDAKAMKSLSDNTAFSREHYKKMYDDANDFYQSLVANAGDHTQAEVDDARLKMEQQRKIYENWRDAAKADFAAVGAAASGFVQDFVDGLSFLDQNLDDTRVKVKLLDGEVVSLKEAVDRFNAGNSITYDLTSTAGVEQYRKLNPGAQISLSDAQIIAMVSAGATLQSLITQGYINPYAGMAQAYGGFTGRPVSASGNMMMPGVSPIASPAAAATSAGASPLASTDLVGSGGGIAMTNNFQVNGTADQVAQQIADKIKQQLMAKASLTRKFGSGS